MPESIKILGIAGSLRKASYNKGALRAAQQLCPQGAKACGQKQTSKVALICPLSQADS